MGLLTESLCDFNKAIDLDQYNSIIYSNRGLVLRKLERFDDAIEDYSKELELVNDSISKIRVLNNRAYWYAKINQFDKAIEDYSVVIAEDKNNIHAYHNRGISYERIWECVKAITW